MQEVRFPVAVPGFTFTILIKHSQNAEVILTCKLVGGAEIYTIQRYETAIEHRYLPPL